MVFANISSLTNHFYSFQNNNYENFSEDLTQNVPNPAQTDLDRYFTGEGNNQTVREYMENVSSIYDNSQNFEIPSPVDNAELTRGGFNFTFQNNYTTEYVLEDDNALFPDQDQIKFEFNSKSYLDYTQDMNLTTGDLTDLTQTTDIYSSYLILNSTDQGEIEFTLHANFSDTESNLFSSPISFNRSKIAGLFAELDFNLSANANVTIKLRDKSSGWNDIVNNIEYNSTLGPHNINKTAINTNLKYINNSDCVALRYVLNRTDQSEFNATLYNLNLNTILVSELPIRNNSYVAMEFDLKGLGTTVNGFYAWIRTLNTTLAPNTELNITLFRADQTIVRTESNLRDIDMNPDYSQQIDSFILQDFTKDNLSYFSFDETKTGGLNVSNYFIVIRSNNSKRVYNLVTIPWFNYGDGETEHQLKKTEDGGQNWVNAKSQYEGNPQLDASQFKLNVTRGYKPSDFLVNGSISLQIQNISLADQSINSYPYNESSNLEWGIGTWEIQNLPESILNNSQGNFLIDLEWNSTITNDFIFNVSYYAEAFKTEIAHLFYNVTYNSVPEWTLNYSLDITSPRYDQWDFTELKILYPEYFNAHNLTDPDSNEILEEAGGEQSFSENEFYKVISISDDFVASPGGQFKVYMTSSNAIQDMHSYIKYKNKLWETEGFMFGDNISTKMDITDYKGKAPAPTNGMGNVTLYFPNGSIYEGKELYSESGIQESDSILSYSFSNQTILNLTNNIPEFGKYSLGFFWKNGSMVGCKKQDIYIDRYEINMNNTVYSPNLGNNYLIGTTTHRISPNLNYSLLIASVNETTGIHRPNYYTLNRSNIDQDYSYEEEGHTFPLRMTDFKQNETVLNPGENVKFDIAMQNRDDFFDVDVSVSVKLVSYFNEEWIISQETSAVKNLKLLGETGDTRNFNVELSIPTLSADGIWQGVNAPIRKGGVKTIITFYLEGNEVDSFLSDQYSVLINQTDNQFEGEIISLKTSLEKRGKGISPAFARDECLYLPDNTSFIINVFDKHYVSSYNEFREQFSLKYDSQFEDISITPLNPLNGKTFNISANLVQEFGEAIIDENVICQQYVDGSWINITQLKATGDNGTVQFKLDTQDLAIKNQILLRFAWQGNEYILANTQNFTVDIAIQENKLSISLSRENDLVYRNTKAILRFSIKNTGNSTLAIEDLEITIDGDLSFSIVEYNYIKEKNFKPNETISLKIEVEIPNVNFDLLNISIQITAKNLISNEVVTQESRVTFTVLDYPFGNYLVVFSTVLMLLIFALLWLGALLYRRKIKTDIEGPKEKEEKKPEERKKEGYKKVGELEKEKKSKGKSLDAVLEEEELIREGKDKKKKSKNAK